MNAKIASTLILFSLSAASAWAWPERKFECKNIEGLPNNTYEFRKINAGGVDLPYVVVQRHYRGPLDQNGVVTTQSTRIQGLAAESINDKGVETLMLGSLRFEFTNDELFGCKAP